MVAHTIYSEFAASLKFCVYCTRLKSQIQHASAPQHGWLI